MIQAPTTVRSCPLRAHGGEGLSSLPLGGPLGAVGLSPFSSHEAMRREELQLGNVYRLEAGLGIAPNGFRDF